jgi:hypothetical protein
MHRTTTYRILFDKIRFRSVAFLSLSLSVITESASPIVKLTGLRVLSAIYGLVKSMLPETLKLRKSLELS